MTRQHIVVVGSGNAALCAGIAALEAGADVTILEKATLSESGGNSRYTAGAMRFAYASREEILALLRDPSEARLADTEFGSYPKDKFATDMLHFNEGRPLNDLQRRLIDDSYATMLWLTKHNIRFDPIYSRQTFQKNGKYVFWGGLTLESKGEGVGLVDAQIKEFERLGGRVRCQAECRELLLDDGVVTGVVTAVATDVVTGVRLDTPNSTETITCNAVVLACGGFESSPEMRGKLLGERWQHAKVRGTPHNTGAGLTMAQKVGAELVGRIDGCHAVPMDLHMPDYGNQDLPFIERKNYRKICYFLGVMLNARGERFVDEGQNFRNYTYAQFGRAILEQPDSFAWQIFDQKVEPLLYDEYRFEHASFVEANTLEELVTLLEGVNPDSALQTLQAFNEAVDDAVVFDPSSLDGRRTHGLKLDKTNWANKLDTPPYRAYPVTCGITFTYAGVKIDDSAAVLSAAGERIPGLFACGEMVGGIFFDGYPGGSGLTSGAVFGRLAGKSAVSV